MKVGLISTVALVALSCLPHGTIAQTREMIELGKALAGPQAQPEADLVQTSKTGQQASRAYARCLEDNAVEFGKSGVDAYSAVRAAKGSCINERNEFFSAVYQDRRASAAHRSSVNFANQMLGYFDEDTNAQLPGVVMRSSAKHNAEQPQPDRYDQLEKIKRLLDSGAISQDEFNAEKTKILSR